MASGMWENISVIRRREKARPGFYWGFLGKPKYRRLNGLGLVSWNDSEGQALGPQGWSLSAIPRDGERVLVYKHGKEVVGEPS